MLLQVQELTLTQTKNLRTLVSNLTFSLEAGDKMAIIGEEGNGKSSLLKVLVGDPTLTSYLEMNGHIQRNYAASVYIPQQLDPKYEQLSLNQFFFEDLEVDLDYATLYRLADELHFNSERFSSDQPLSTLSGGEKLKVQLLKALSIPSDLIFLDESSNDLDLETLIWLEHYLTQCPQAVLFVSHDEQFLETVATKMIHLESFKKRKLAQTTVQNVDYQTYKNGRKTAYGKQQRQAQNDRKEFDKALQRHQRQKSQVRHNVLNTHDATAGRLAAKKMKSVLSKERNLERQREQLTEIPLNEEAIEIFFSNIQPLPKSKIILDLKQEQLQQGYRTLINSINLQIRGQEKIGLIGANGVGKSTLLSLVYHKLQKQSDLQLGYMPQDYSLFLDMESSPLEFLQTQQAGQAQTYLANLQFSRDEVHQAIRNLSGGQQAKVLLAKMVLDEANFLILDEPSRNFSPTSQPEIRQLFQEYPGGLICVSHDRRFLSQVCDKLYQVTPQGLEEIPFSFL